MSLEKLGHIRARIAEIEVEYEQTQKALVPFDTALARLQSWITRTGAGLAPAAVSGLMHPGATGQGLEQFLDATRPGQLTTLLCALIPAQLEARLREQLEAYYSRTTQTILSEKAREDSLAQLRQQLYALEVQEERCVRSLEEGGQYVSRRAEIVHLDVVLADLD